MTGSPSPRRRHRHHRRLRGRRIGARRHLPRRHRRARRADGSDPLADVSLPDNGGALRAATRARRCSRRPRSTSRTGSSSAHSDSPTRSPRAWPRATRPHRTGSSASRASSRALLEVDRRVRPRRPARRVWSYRVVGDAPWQSACGSQPAAVTWCAPRIRPREVGHRRLGPERLPARHGSTRCRRLRRQERRLLPLRREDRRS